MKGALEFLALDDPAMLDQFGRGEIHERPHPRRPAKIGVGQRPQSGVKLGQQITDPDQVRA